MTEAIPGGKKRSRFYLVSTMPVVMMLVITGIGNLVPFEHIANDMQHLGYPPYFRIILGIWKIIAAVVIIMPKRTWFKDLAYMGVLLDLSGAAASRLAVGDGAVKVIIPLLISVVVIVSWRNYRRTLMA